MIKKYLLAVICLYFLISCTSCFKSTEEKHEERVQEIEKAVETRGGHILGKATIWGSPKEIESRIVYTQGDTLFCWSTQSDEPIKLFNNFDDIKVYEYTIDFTSSGARIIPTITPLTQISIPSYDENNEEEIKGTDIFNTVDISNLYRMDGQWIFIGGDFVANIFEPTKLIDISDLGIGEIEKLFNTALPQTRKVYSDVWTGYIDYSGYNSDLKLSLYGENHQLPGFSTYNTKISDLEWGWGGLSNSDERYKNDYHFRVDARIASSPDDIRIEQVYWRNNAFSPDAMTSTGLQSYYKEREEEVLQQIEEDREQQKQEMIQRIKEQAVSFNELVNAYYGNTAFGRNKYPTGQTYILKVEFESVLSSNSSRYAYRFKDYKTILQSGYFYSNDHSLASMRFPFTGYVSCYFDSYSKDYVMFSDEVYEMTFYFTDTEAVLWFE